MFNLIKIENGRMNVPEPVFYEAAAEEEIATGEALVISEGYLTKCGATETPTHIAIGSVAADAKNRKVAVYRVESNMLFEVPVTAVPTSLKLGDKVTLDATALSVTATTASGVVTVESINGATAAGDKIVVRI